MYFKNLIYKKLVSKGLVLSKRNIILIASAIIGVLAGLAAILLKEIVHLLNNYLTENNNHNFLQSHISYYRTSTNNCIREYFNDWKFKSFYH